MHSQSGALLHTISILLCPLMARYNLAHSFSCVNYELNARFSNLVVDGAEIRIFRRSFQLMFVYYLFKIGLFGSMVKVEIVERWLCSGIRAIPNQDDISGRG